MNIIMEQILSNKYKYGFWSNIFVEKFPMGLSDFNLNILSKRKKETVAIHYFRIKAYKKWEKMNLPLWSDLKIPKINLNQVLIYSSPIIKNNKLNFKILSTFEKCGIDLDNTSNIATDAIFDSISIITTFKNKLAKYGIIFNAISETLINYSLLINLFLGSVISYSDNFFSALNSAVFSDGSFCYVPKNIICPLELSTYFRINDKYLGQFERTLIVVESYGSISYLEGCTAAQYFKYQLHAAVVELIAFQNAKIKYSTIQNWYSGNINGIGGVLNFVTKRGLCLGQNSSIIWTQIETGSSITWKYPGSILVGFNSISEFYSVTLTKYYQQTDTGTKMVHLGSFTKSKIISKSISSNFSKNIYRSLIKIAQTAKHSRVYSQCDSFIVGKNSKIIAYPYFDMLNFKSIIEHEAKISKINKEQLFYLQQRGLSVEVGLKLILMGFCKDVFNMLPMEFAKEANQLLQIYLNKK